jgi:hypothetical protein
MTLVTGLVGIGLLAAFLGIMVWWVKALPLTLIVLVVMAMLVYDLVQTLRHGEDGPQR